MQVFLQSDSTLSVIQIQKRPNITKQEASVRIAINPTMQLRIASFYIWKKQKKVGWLVIRLKVRKNQLIF